MPGRWLRVRYLISGRKLRGHLPQGSHRQGDSYIFISRRARTRHFDVWQLRQHCQYRQRHLKVPQSGDQRERRASLLRRFPVNFCSCRRRKFPVSLTRSLSATVSLSLSAELTRCILMSCPLHELRLRQSRTKRPNIWRMCVRDVLDVASLTATAKATATTSKSTSTRLAYCTNISTYSY